MAIGKDISSNYDYLLGASSVHLYVWVCSCVLIILYGFLKIARYKPHHEKKSKLQGAVFGSANFLFLFHRQRQGDRERTYTYKYIVVAIVKDKHACLL